jgi:NAD dependent epimerase/dehydratase
MNWNGKRVLVTGAGGFIGSHLAECLVELGATVRAFTHYNALGSYGWLDTSPLASQMEIVAGDITDRDSVDAAVKDSAVVFHLAALIAIPYSYRVPTAYARTNVEGSINALTAAREHGVECFLQTSTSETYGTARRVPIDEEHPLHGQSPYAASKIGADKMAEAFHASFNVPVVVVRPFNTFGPRQSARAVIPTIITQCLTGSVVKLGNLHTTRDLNFVANTVDGFVAAAETPAAVGQIFNFGSGREISIGDLAQLIAGRIGKNIQIEPQSERLRPRGSEVERLLADSRRAREILGWTPRVSLEEGLDRTIGWLQTHQKDYRAGIYVI